MKFLTLSLFTASLFAITPKYFVTHNTLPKIPKPQYEKNTLIVEFAINSSPLIYESTKGLGEIKVLNNISKVSSNTYGILKVKTSLKKALSKLKNNPLIKDISFNYKRKPLNTPNDPYFTNQWYLSGNGGIDINVLPLWDYSIGNDNIVVAVFDTGISLKHEDLGGNIFVNKKELYGKSGVDDDGNGYVDDVYGYDFAHDLEGNNAPLHL